MAQVYGAGGKTVPKKGRLGTGSYYPEGTPLYKRKGNVFPGINVAQPQFHQLTFGNPSRAGIATVVGQDRTNFPAIHPNKAHYNTITLPLAPAMVVASSNEASNLQPVPPRNSNLSMPNERNTNSATGTKKKPLVYRTAFGASKTMPTDSAFQHNPNAMYTHSVRQRPNNAKEAVKKSATDRTFAHMPNPPAVRGGMDNSGQQHRDPPPSFTSHGNIWYDPHNSFIAGQPTTTAPNGAVGRWSIVKTGVISVARTGAQRGA